MLFVTRAKKLRDYGLSESAFYAAFLDGGEIELDVAKEIDIDYRDPSEEQGEESSEESNEDDELPEQAVEQTVEENPDEA